MSENNSDPPDFARQLAQHIDSLRGAGIEWVPQSEPLPPPSASQPAARVALPTLSASLEPAAVQTSIFNAASAPPAADLEQRQQALAALAKQVANCTRCSGLASTRTQTVFGVGPLDPDVCFVGEAPGVDEDRIGEPFVGAAGQLLTRIIVASGLKREEVFICNIIRCRPPGNRQPNPDEAENCNEWLVKTLELVRPKFMVSLGNTPLRYLLGITGQGITKVRGRFYAWRGIPVLATYHPSYLLRQVGEAQQQSKKEVWDDMKLLLQRMGRPIPGKG